MLCFKITCTSTGLALYNIGSFCAQEMFIKFFFILAVLEGIETVHLPNLNVLVAISKGMRAVKLYSNKILQFLTGVLANAGCPV